MTSHALLQRYLEAVDTAIRDHSYDPPTVFRSKVTQLNDTFKMYVDDPELIKDCRLEWGAVERTLRSA